MKLTTIALSSLLMLSSTLALAQQAGGSSDATAAGGAHGWTGRGWFLECRQGRHDKPRRRAGQLARLRIGRRLGHYRWRCDRWTGWDWIFQCH
jgi:hypothetical protein